MYFIDFDFYEKYEYQMIGEAYFKTNFGVVPSTSLRISNDKISCSHGEKNLKGNEIKIINNVISRLSKKSHKEIVLHTLGDIPLVSTENLEIIEYETAFYRTPEYSVRTQQEDL